jgi:hypothetical protein
MGKQDRQDWPYRNAHAMRTHFVSVNSVCTAFQAPILNGFLRGLGGAKGASPSEPEYFIKLSKIWIFVDFSAGSQGGLFLKGAA